MAKMLKNAGMLTENGTYYAYLRLVKVVFSSVKARSVNSSLDRNCPIFIHF